MKRPDDSLLQEIEAFARELAIEAGRMLVGRLGTPLEVQYKTRDRHAPVTKADKETEQYLRAAISKRYPDHQIIGEEEEDTIPGASPFAWVLDPLDGTTNFLNGMPIFASSIGVLHDGHPVVGAIYVATSGGLSPGVYHARTGGGAFFDGQPVRVFETESPQPSRLAGVPAHFALFFRLGKALRQEMGEPRSLGSISYEMALVSAGVFQYAVFGGPSIWDVAAGVTIVREAGGDVFFRPWQKGPWRRLEAFEPMSPRRGKGPPALRHWRASMVAGHPALAWFVACNIHRRFRPLRRLLALANRLTRTRP